MMALVVTVVVIFLGCRVVAYLVGDLFRQTAPHRHTDAGKQARSTQPGGSADPVEQWTSIDDAQLGRLLRDQGNGH